MRGCALTQQTTHPSAASLSSASCHARKSWTCAVVIRSRNAVADLHSCLSALALQHIPEGSKLEVVVVDNESDDDSRSVALSKGAMVVDLPRREFSWGRALNRGIAAAKAEYVILLSADASPADPQFVVRIIAPFEDPRIGAVYGRQIPRDDAPLEEIIRLRSYFPSTSETFSSQTDCDASGRGMIASNACAAIRKAVWLETPYDEIVEGAEERVWTSKLLAAGHLCRYEASAIVYHSHRDPLLRGACRHVELFFAYQKQRGRSGGALSFCRWLLGHTKRRGMNLLRPNLSIRVRVLALLDIPLGIGSLTIAYGLMRYNIIANPRDFLWR